MDFDALSESADRDWREKVALEMFCAVLANGGTLDLYPELGEKQMRTCFMMADTFLKVATETATESHG